MRIRISKNLITIFLSLLIILFAFSFIFNIIYSYYSKKVDYENSLRNRFYITNIFPEEAIHAQKIRIEGNKFGWKMDNENYKLLSSDGPIEIVDVWTNEWIEFTIQLDMKPGSKTIWIEKPVSNEDKKTVSSNKVQFRLLNRLDFYPKKGDNLMQRVYIKIYRELYLNYRSRLLAFINYIF